MTGQVREGTDCFTVGLMIDVAEVLEAHGYGRCYGRQLVELQQQLFHFLPGVTDHCAGARMDGGAR